MTALLTTDNIVAGYGRTTVLHGISLALEQGANLGLFGPNGHGKTTLLRTVSGLVRPRAGTVRFDGADIAGTRPRDIVARGLVHVPQGNRLFPDLTIAECITLGATSARARPHEAANRERALAIFPKLSQRWRQRVRTLSGGERQMVSIAVALMGHPRLLLLDEPTLGLAPKIKDELCAAIRAISDGGVPLLVVEQDVEFLLELAPRLYLISHGAVAAELGAESVDHDAIMAMYFGH